MHVNVYVYNIFNIFNLPDNNLIVNNFYRNLWIRLVLYFIYRKQKTMQMAIAKIKIKNIKIHIFFKLTRWWDTAERKWEREWDGVL